MTSWIPLSSLWSFQKQGRYECWNSSLQLVYARKFKCDMCRIQRSPVFFQGCLGKDEALGINRPVVFNLFSTPSIPEGCHLFLLLEMVHHTLIMGGRGHVVGGGSPGIYEGQDSQAGQDMEEVPPEHAVMHGLPTCGNHWFPQHQHSYSPFMRKQELSESQWVSQLLACTCSCHTMSKLKKSLPILGLVINLNLKSRI